jgi:hypothetical protein
MFAFRPLRLDKVKHSEHMRRRSHGLRGHGRLRHIHEWWLHHLAKELLHGLLPLPRNHPLLLHDRTRENHIVVPDKRAQQLRQSSILRCAHFRRPIVRDEAQTHSASGSKHCTTARWLQPQRIVASLNQMRCGCRCGATGMAMCVYSKRRRASQQVAPMDQVDGPIGMIDGEILGSSDGFGLFSA